MKLRNKKTGEIKEVKYWQNLLNECGSLAKLNEEWEDYEEPKYFYCICTEGSINKYEVERYGSESWVKHARLIGNYFETREEAEKAVEKLKAWKRLKDKGFKMDVVLDNFFCLDIYMRGKPYEEIKEDLKIVFGDKL